ncbi:MAG: CPBP family glutamic-type intramembrane protease [Planctomycetaceae bacterium]
MPSALSSYFEESKTPLSNLVFYLPWLILYELGLVLSGDPYRNLADVWLRNVLQWAGFSQYFLLPLLSCAVLLGWHHVSKEQWKIHWHCLPGMFLECIAYTVVLIGVFRLQQVVVSAVGNLADRPAAMALQAGPELAANDHLLLNMVGAGIYEELFFRLLLLPAVIWALLRIELKSWLAYTLGVVLVSVAFAAAHSIGVEQDWFTFAFRFLVGVILGAVFLKRGFGVAVGAHVLYNIAVSLLY